MFQSQSFAGNAIVTPAPLIPLVVWYLGNATLHRGLKPAGKSKNSDDRGFS